MSNNLKKPLTIKEKKEEKLKKIREESLDKKIDNLKLEETLEENLIYIESIFDKISDLVIKEFSIGNSINTVLIYIDDLVNKADITDNILRPLMITSFNEEFEDDILNYGLEELVKRKIINLGDVRTVIDFKSIVEDILEGYGILLFEGVNKAISLNIQEKKGRSVETPEIETVVRGPKEAFVENINTNLGLIRKKIKTSNLKFERFKLGRVSKTDVVISYIEGIVDHKLVKEVKARIAEIDIDSIAESGTLEQLIEDNPFSPFPQIISTERADRAVDSLNKGRVVILVDGTPFILITPSVFVDFLQASEDYYNRFLFPTAIRLLRFIAFWIALLAPSIYVAITTFHQEMIPTSLLINIAASRAGVPFPAIVEATLMEISFEALREAGLRLPMPVGQAVSIVGALIVGEAAVQAGIVSQAMVIVVALTGIASFTVPSYAMGLGVRVFRFPIMFLAGTWGMFGITFAVLALLIHLSNLRSFGVPYLSPLVPINWSGLRDSIIKVPEWARNSRSPFIVKRNEHRIKFNSMPSPEDRSDNNEE